ncbi:hypothetical protein PILCRDRAFT_813720 [Piloderma croceum F 1598]|uniref:Uncharacterized protein n=1 Tax=Piloderma croceum (strain F 1598) TaxID=765440 RepID=A0A0C3GAH3_PILCF|nr:hypothetical protein PILCRDRAFT_813720 [Piloderma croceum F 1598]
MGWARVDIGCCGLKRCNGIRRPLKTLPRCVSCTSAFLSSPFHLSHKSTVTRPLGSDRLPQYGRSDSTPWPVSAHSVYRGCWTGSPGTSPSHQLRSSSESQPLLLVLNIPPKSAVAQMLLRLSSNRFSSFMTPRS